MTDRDTNRAILKTVLEQIDEQGAPEHEWLFILAGAIKAYYPCGKDVDPRPASKFKGHALSFGERMHRQGRGRGYIDWDCPSAVGLEWEVAWEKRQKAHGQCLLDRAIQLGEHFFLDLEHGVLVDLMINAGFVMQELQPGEPFYFPVNEEMADRFETAKRTLQLMVNKAISLGFFMVEEEASIGRARRLRFNYRHRELKGRIRSARAALKEALKDEHRAASEALEA